ncbi:MAG: hypothetical protein K2Q12_03230, partial [Rickettsiales bacterium]|nr:hypothetical protein [Rickettsiales bacterium]
MHKDTPTLVQCAELKEWLNFAGASVRIFSSILIYFCENASFSMSFQHLLLVIPALLPCHSSEGWNPDDGSAGSLKFTNEVQHYDKVLCLWEKPIDSSR